MVEERPIILWFRRDLRLGDHPALASAAASGRPLIPVFLHDEVVETHGAAPRWRLDRAVASFAARLGAAGSRLVLRRGPALAALQALVAETGAGAVWWSRLHDPAARARDQGVKAALKAAGIEARSFPGHVLFEPWTVATGQGGSYKVFTPFWQAIRGRDPGPVLPAPGALRPPAVWPASERLEGWGLGAAMRRGAAVVERFATVGEVEAGHRLARFVSDKLHDYSILRDVPAADATSGLSENLTYGEVSARQCWAAGMQAREQGNPGAEAFLRELGWREFACHLIHHAPQIVEREWRPDWQGFPWRGEGPALTAWRRGQTGVDFVDAAMREMYVTGRMHNRARMVAASFLTKHLLTDWRLGAAWFADCLTDWDPAANAMGWQWVAGSGPDAAPFFRVFNPQTQADRFDPDGAYRRAWIAEGQADPPPGALAWFDAVPRRWRLSPDTPRPAPVVGLAEGRVRALAVLERWNRARSTA